MAATAQLRNNCPNHHQQHHHQYRHIAMIIINVIILIKYEADIVLKFRIFGQPWNTDLTGSLSQYFQTLGSVHQRTPGFKSPLLLSLAGVSDQTSEPHLKT